MFCFNSLCSKAKQLRIVLRHGIRPDFLEIHLLYFFSSKNSSIISRRYFTKLSQMRYATTILADLTVTFLTKSLLFTVPKTVLKYISSYVALVMN